LLKKNIKGEEIDEEIDEGGMLSSRLIDADD